MWAATEALGDERSYFLLEEYVAGDVYHVDSIVYEREVLAAVAEQVRHAAFDVSHSGGVFTTRLLDRDTARSDDLLALNARLLTSLGLVRGVSHSEYIRGRDGRLVFLETSARVGGAHIAELVEAATGVNMWAEWAKIEVAGGNAPYAVPPDATGLRRTASCRSRGRNRPTSAPTPIRKWSGGWRSQHHAGLIVRSPSAARVDELLARYADALPAGLRGRAAARRSTPFD